MSDPSRPRGASTTGSPGPRSPSWVEVDLGALRHNVGALRELLGPGCGVWAVVKANAYGHGAVPAARAALLGGAMGLAVASLSEALDLRRAGVGAPILLLSAGDPGSADQLVREEIIQAACRGDVMTALSRAAVRIGKPAKVHLKLDTGLGRLGVQPERAVEFAQLMQGLPGLTLDGVFSHLATAEATDTTYADQQFARFRSAVLALRAAGINPGVRHLANSAATLRFPEMRLDGVRAGLLIYGLRPDAPGLAPLSLRPALTWKTRLAFTQRVPGGSAISYGGTHVTRDECLLGVLPLGYADGYPRRASNRAHVLLRGQPCPVVGTVCMDHVIVNASAAGDVQPGEEVVLVGRQGEHQVTANDLARWAETCLHEVTTVIGSRVARVYANARAAEQPRGHGDEAVGPEPSDGGG